MAWNPLTAANVAVGKFLTTTIMGKIKDCLEYLYGLTNRTIGTQILNGSFELDSDSDGVPDNWTTEAYAGGTIALETTAPGHGAKSIKFVHPGGASNGGGYADSDYLEVSELETNAIRFIHWATAAGMKNKVQIRYFTKAKVELGAGSPADVYNSTSNPTTPTQFIYQFTPLATARYIKVRIIGGYTDTNVAGTAYFDGIRIDPAISTARLKTSSGSVSISGGATTASNVILPGGAYGFFPRTRFTVGGATGRNVIANVQIYYSTHSATYDSGVVTTVYLSGENSTSADSWLISETQTYVTSSGEVFWIYILRDKKTKQTIASYVAPDHPCFGNGGKPLVIPHPFLDYNHEKHEIVVVNPTDDQLLELHNKMIIADESKPDLSLIQVVNTLYEIDEKGGSPDWPTKAVTVGLPPDRDWRKEKDGTPVIPIKKQIPKMDYFITRTLRLK